MINKDDFPKNEYKKAIKMLMDLNKLDIIKDNPYYKHKLDTVRENLQKELGAYLVKKEMAMDTNNKSKK